MLDWIQNNNSKHPELNSWNVVLAGLQAGKEVQTPAGPIHAINRSAKYIDEINLDLGALLSSKDLLLDIDLDENRGIENRISSFKNTLTSISDIRKDTSEAKKPVLLLYVVDGKSKAPRKNCKKPRYDLDQTNDLIGLTVLLPELDYKTHKEGYWQIPVRMISDIEGSADLEGE